MISDNTHWLNRWAFEMISKTVCQSICHGRLPVILPHIRKGAVRQKRVNIYKNLMPEGLDARIVK
jgi:hypothetical protein